MTLPYSSYVICGSPRSGSTLLCEMLAATGVAGRPNSFFRVQSIMHWAERWGVPHAGGVDDAEFDRAYLAAMQREGAAGTDVFGLRLMWVSVAEASRRLDRVFGATADIAERLEQAFGPTLYIHLSRRDKAAQAVSLLKAEQSGLWHLSADGTVFEGAAAPAPTAYDAGRLAAILRERQGDDAAWADFFAARRIEPVRLVYETMTADPRLALASILGALGRDPGIARTIPVGTAKMADATNAAWAERLRDSVDGE